MIAALAGLLVLFSLESAQARNSEGLRYRIDHITGEVVEMIGERVEVETHGPNLSETFIAVRDEAEGRHMSTQAFLLQASEERANEIRIRFLTVLYEEVLHHRSTGHAVYTRTFPYSAGPVPDFVDPRLHRYVIVPLEDRKAYGVITLVNGAGRWRREGRFTNAELFVADMTVWDTFAEAAAYAVKEGGQLGIPMRELFERRGKSHAYQGPNGYLHILLHGKSVAVRLDPRSGNYEVLYDRKAWEGQNFKAVELTDKSDPRFFYGENVQTVEVVAEIDELSYKVRTFQEALRSITTRLSENFEFLHEGGPNLHPFAPVEREFHRVRMVDYLTALSDYFAGLEREEHPHDREVNLIRGLVSKLDPNGVIGQLLLGTQPEARMSEGSFDREAALEIIRVAANELEALLSLSKFAGVRSESLAERSVRQRLDGSKLTERFHQHLQSDLSPDMFIFDNAVDIQAERIQSSAQLGSTQESTHPNGTPQGDLLLLRVKILATAIEGLQALVSQSHLMELAGLYGNGVAMPLALPPQVTALMTEAERGVLDALRSGQLNPKVVQQLIVKGQTRYLAR